jgi:ATP-dependent Lon protease
MVLHEIGMTGEITLRGRILPVGGVREKVLTAHRAGLTSVLLPRHNEKDLVDVPKRARKQLKINLVDHMDQVIELALAPVPAEDFEGYKVSKPGDGENEEEDED